MLSCHLSQALCKQQFSGKKPLNRVSEVLLETMQQIHRINYYPPAPSSHCHTTAAWNFYFLGFNFITPLSFSFLLPLGWHIIELLKWSSSQECWMSGCLWTGANTALETGKRHSLACTRVSFQTQIKKEFLVRDCWPANSRFSPACPCGHISLLGGWTLTTRDAKLSFPLLSLGFESARLRSVGHQL